jgi:hypothetical protein
MAKLLRYIASLGQFAPTGITAHARWALLDDNPFGIIDVSTRPFVGK